MRTIAGLFCIVLLMETGGCNSASPDDQSNTRAGQAAEPATVDGQVTGTIRYLDLEGGFYGIETDDGIKLDPVNLPEDFRKDGLRIRAWVEDVKDRVSFRMWGRLVRIRDIERL